MTAQQDQAFVILDMADAHNWSGDWGAINSEYVRIPSEKRSTVLHMNRDRAERELLRLARMHPTGHFVLFEAASVGLRIDMPTHVNVHGYPIRMETVVRLAPIVERPPF